MPTRVSVDVDLLAAAMAASGLPNKRATVEEALRLLLGLSGQVETLRELKGIGWGSSDEEST
jgi:Arc/MetJ family transcription regulator